MFDQSIISRGTIKYMVREKLFKSIDYFFCYVYIYILFFKIIFRKNVWHICFDNNSSL